MQTAFLSPQTGAIILGILSLGWVGLGSYWGRKSKTFEDHALAGRTIGLALGSATAVATWITTNTTMVAPQFALKLGVWGMLAYASASIGLFVFAPLCSRIRQLLPHGFTSGDFMRLRYNRPVWGLFILLSLFYSLVGLVGMSMAGGLLIETLSGIPYRIGMSVILLVCVLYTLRGGLYAVIGTDFIQSLIILIGILVVAFSILHQVEIPEIYRHLQKEKPALLDIMFPAAIMALFNNLLYGIGEIFHSNIWWSRAFSFRKGVGKKAFILAGVIWIPIPIIMGFIALASGPLGLHIPLADTVAPFLAAHVLGPLGAVAIFIVVFCSLASSLDSMLAATSDLITEDIYRQLFRPQASPYTLKRASQLITLGIGILTWGLAWLKIGSLTQVLFLSGALVGSMIWPILTGLFWRSANSRGAFWGMALGSLVGLIAYFKIGWYVGALVGTVVSMLVVWVFSWFSSQRFDWSYFERTKEGVHGVS